MRSHRDALEALGEAIEQELTYLKGLQAAYDKEISARITTAPPVGNGAVEFGKSIQARTLDLLTSDRKRQRDLEKLSREEARLDAELHKRSGEHRAAPTRVTVELTTPKEGRVELELSYRQHEAFWKPFYEARLSVDRSRLDLVLTAAVVQRTGEAWEGVRLEISNARPSLSLAVPVYGEGQMVSWEKEAPMPPSPAIRGASVTNNTFNVQSNTMARMATPLPPPRPAAQSTTPVAAMESMGTTIQEASGLAATFLVDGAKEVPSDGEPHRFRVLATSLTPVITVFTSPRLDPKAFLMARFDTPQGMPLFPNATVVRFAGMQRLGEAPLVLPPAGQPFALGFGPYKGVRVSFRRLDLKKEEVGAFSKDRQWTLRERMEFTNDGNESLEVEVQDRILKSGSDQVKIALLPDFSGDWNEIIPGVRTWKFKLDAKGQKRLELPLTVRAPREGFLQGFAVGSLPVWHWRLLGPMAPGAFTGAGFSG